MANKPSFPVLMAPGRWGSVTPLSPSEALEKITTLAAAAGSTAPRSEDEDIAVAEEALAIFAGQILAWGEANHGLSGLKHELLAVIDKVAGYDRAAANAAELAEAREVIEAARAKREEEPANDNPGVATEAQYAALRAGAVYPAPAVPDAPSENVA
jgi:hypothetical protein